MRQTIAGFIAVVLILNSGCREGVPLFNPELPRPDAESVRQITFGTGHDRDPRWSPDGSSLIYHSSNYGMLPQAQGVLLSLDPELVRATPLFAEVQQRGELLLATPVYSRDGAQIAFTQLLEVDDVTPCVVPLSAPAHAHFLCATQPVLGSAALRVRRMDATGPLSDDPSIRIDFPGTDPAFRDGAEGPFVEQLYPFQELHRTEHAMLFRPSWAPDGQRVVVSNGLRLLIWRVGSATLDTIPNTAEGVSPAWSPDGQWIAFTQLVRGSARTYGCECASPGRTPTATHIRTSYDIAERRLVLVRPDGSDYTVLGEGEDPTWSPDGQDIYASRDGAIVRIPRSGGSAVTIPNTMRARSPSVSPDGQWLAFSRAKAPEPKDHDIWLVSLAQ